MTLFLSLILSVVILVLGVWLAATMQQSKEQLLVQMSQKDKLLSQKDMEISRLTTIIASRDPMTYQILSAEPTSSLTNPSEVIGIGTDEDEYKRWAVLTGKISPDGEDDMDEDLKMFGYSG